MEFEIFTAMAISAFMVFVVVWIHYEVLCFLSKHSAKFMNLHGRYRILSIIIGVFIAHTLEVWAYAICYYVINQMGWGSLAGVTTEEQGVLAFLYYSTSTYTSLGMGDVFPMGVMRLVSGVEALIGLLLIGWSASFTYLSMEKYWHFNGNPSSK